MQQRQLTDEYHDEAMSGLSDVMKTSRRTGGGFDFDSERVLKTFDHSAEEREAYYRKLWDKGGFRFHGMNYSDFLTDHAANDEAYQFWTKNVRARIKDPRKRDLLAPLEKPHAIGGKRPSMEQWYYDIFDKPNVDIVDVRQNPIQDIVPEGIRTSDGVIHELDVIALATGFDSVTGGLKAMQIQGTKGLLRDKWEDGILTHLGISISSFPNFFMVYGPQAPTAFVNGPSAVEPQVDWIVAVLEEMRASGRDRIEATSEAEQEWRKVVWAFSERSLRHHIPSGWNGGNIPGKRQEPLSLASGLAYYCDKLDEVRTQGMVGFDIS